LLTVIGSLLPDDHVLPKSMYEAQKLLRALKMTYEQIHACPKGCVLFSKEYVEAKCCPKCKSSRFMEVDSGDGQKRQLDIPLTILRHLSFILRIQRLYMTEESAKQMTWHKNGKRYNPDKMVHASDGEAWKHFDAIHREGIIVILVHVLNICALCKQVCLDITYISRFPKKITMVVIKY
jgi:hypothetical protein